MEKQKEIKLGQGECCSAVPKSVLLVMLHVNTNSVQVCYTCTSLVH